MAELQTTVVADGTALRYRVWEPSAPLRAQLVLFNGIMSNSRWFEPLAPTLRSAGLRMVGADRRGSGENELGRGDAPSAAVLVEDALAIIAAEARPTVPLVLVGWCWGAALAIAVAHKLGGDLHGLALVTPGLFPTEAVKSAVAKQRELIAQTAAGEAAIESPIRDEYFTHGPALEAFVRRDERRLRFLSPRLLEISAKLGAAALTRLPKLGVPMTLVLAEHEDATDNAATLAAFARFSSEQLRQITLPTRHGVQFEAPQELAGELVSLVHRVEARAA